ncbi:MAG: PHP domain-containing protein [Candidatus Omnitrophica bacterium]|nr:PHP domain-containing protein [Candidatus Omnitrophota bacterium]
MSPSRLNADLHIHTHFSDSSLSPQDVVTQAYQNDIHCLAITDHDTVAGIAPTMELAKEYDIEVIPAIELSSCYHNKDIHILGYGFDYENIDIIEQFNVMQRERVTRMALMIEKLKAVGIDNITLDEVRSLACSDSVGRPHLARILKRKKWVKSLKEAFIRFLDEQGIAYVPKYKLSPKEAIDLIRKANGVAVLAHPMITRVDELIPRFVEDGLDGLEVYYPNISNTIIRHYTKITQKYGMILTGGSDAHGEGKDTTFIGKIKLPYENVVQLKNRISQR